MAWTPEQVKAYNVAYYRTNHTRALAYRAFHRDQLRADHLRRTFGITTGQYAAVLDRQGGGCGVCGKKEELRKLAVDHDHESGDIRGILCNGCNRHLGLYEKGRTYKPELTDRFARYLKGEYGGVPAALTNDSAVRNGGVDHGATS